MSHFNLPRQQQAAEEAQRQSLHMAFNMHNTQSSSASTSTSDLYTCMPKTFPPLPPFPPLDAKERLQSTGKASPAATWQSRQFGMQIPGNTQTASSDNVTAFQPEVKMVSTETMMAAQRLYDYQCQASFPHHWTRDLQLEASENQNDTKQDIDTKMDFNGALQGEKDFGSLSSPVLSLTNPPQPKPSGSNSQKKSKQPGRSIWSINPEELSALAMEVAITKQKTTEQARKLSYAEASRRNLLGLAGRLVGQHTEAKKLEQPPTRTFKKYYGLPVIPFTRLPPGSGNFEDKEVPAGAHAREENLSNVQVCGPSVGLSANTPTFYPRQSTDTTELIQMLNTSLESKKIAPHMDWWPGDWKCTNCGNHVLFLIRLLC